MLPDARPGAAGRREQACLLLVDDERDFAEALAFRLETRGLPCLTACRGEEALALLDTRDLDVVLLDLNMPGMHGLDALKAIKERRPDVEVLLLTGETDLAAAATGMRRGAGDYLIKPVDFDLLLTSLEKARKRAREHRERLRAAEAGKLMALGALAAGVGHEINNPLQIILQRSEWLQELLEEARKTSPDYPEMIKSAGIIQQQARRAGEITSQLLALARKTRDGTAEADAGEAARRAASWHAARAGELGVAIHLDIEPDLPLVPCSPAELEPVLSHLLRNALDAVEALAYGTSPAAPVRGSAPVKDSAFAKVPTPAEESASVGSMDAGSVPGPGKGEAPVRAAEIFVSAGRGPDGLRIVVRDTGEGIAPDMAAFIFDPFFSLRPVGKGTGLGLTVCHSIVTALRGSIQYAPAPGGGAIFTVDLPLAPEDRSQAGKAAPQPKERI